MQSKHEQQQEESCRGAGGDQGESWRRRQNRQPFELQANPFHTIYVQVYFALLQFPNVAFWVASLGVWGGCSEGEGGRLHLRLSTETLTSVDPVAVQVGSPQSAHVAQLRLCVNKVKITQVCVSKTQSELAASQEEGVHKPPQWQSPNGGENWQLETVDRPTVHS